MKKQQLLWAFSLHPHHWENGFHFGATDGLELSKSETVAGKQQPCVRQQGSKKDRWEWQENTEGQQKQCAGTQDHACQGQGLAVFTGASDCIS